MIKKNIQRYRVMHLIGSLQVGGAEQVVCTLLQGFRKTDVQGMVIALAGGPLEHELNELGFEVMIRPFSWACAPLWLIRTALELHRCSVDVLHTHLFTTDQLGRLVGLLSGVPVVTTLHSPSTWKRSRNLKNRLKRLVDMLTSRHLCAGLVAISQEIKDYQSRYGGIPANKMCIIGNPVYTDRFNHDEDARTRIRKSNGIGEKDIVLITVAGLKPIKAQDDLLHAFARLVFIHKQLKLFFVGDGPCRNELEDLSIKLGLNEHVIFCGMQQDVSAYLSASDIFVLCSLSEGISMAILEAMAASLPVVATAVGGNIALVNEGQTGFLIPSREPVIMADTIDKLIADLPAARIMGRKGAEFVRRHYDVSLICDQYADIYQETKKISS